MDGMERKGKERNGMEWNGMEWNGMEWMVGQDTTPCLDRFEAVVDDMKKRGQTAIYSSIVEATKMLQQLGLCL